MVGHIPEPLDSIIFLLMRYWKILEIKVEISVGKRATLESTWLLRDSIEIPATFYVHGARINKLQVRKVIENSDVKQE